MRSFMSSVEFNELGNSVTLEKFRSNPLPERFRKEEVPESSEAAAAVPPTAETVQSPSQDAADEDLDDVSAL